MELFEWLTQAKIGLFLNIVGTLIIAFSFGKNIEDANQIDRKGRKVYLVSFLHPKLFYWGLILVIIGFILQFIA